MRRVSKFHAQFSRLTTQQLEALRKDEEFLNSMSKDDRYRCKQSLDMLIFSRKNYFRTMPKVRAAKLRNFAIYRLEGAKGLRGMIYELSAHGLLSAEERSKLSYGFDTIKLGIDSALETLRAANERLKKESKK